MKLKKIYQNKILVEDHWLNLGKKQIRLYNLSEGKDYSEDEIFNIIYDIALEKAYYFIGRKEISSSELKIKLLQYFIFEDIVDKVITHLKDNRYLDDEEYIRNYIENKKLGKQRVVYELRTLGLDIEKIEKVYSELMIDEKEYIKYYLKKIKNKADDKKVGYLIRRGFSLEDIKESLGVSL